MTRPLVVVLRDEVSEDVLVVVVVMGPFSDESEVR